MREQEILPTPQVYPPHVEQDGCKQACKLMIFLLYARLLPVPLQGTTIRSTHRSMWFDFIEFCCSFKRSEIEQDFQQEPVGKKTTRLMHQA